MKILLLLGLLASAAYASGPQTWNTCWSHVLDRASLREIDVRYDERFQRSLADIDRDGSLAPRFRAGQSALSGEIEATVDAELARIHMEKPFHLRDLRREEGETPAGIRTILWYRGKDLVVQRVIFKRQSDQAQTGQILEINTHNENEWSARPTLGSFLIYGPLGRPVAEIQVARHVAVLRSQADVAPSLFVEGEVPYVSAIYRYEYTEKQNVVVDRPSRQEQRARTIARNREREFRNLRDNPVEVDLYEGDEWVGYYEEHGQSLMQNGGRRFKPTRPQVKAIPEIPYVWEKLVFYPPTLYDTENRTPTLIDRLAARGNYIHGGGVTYEERNPVGGLHVQVECNNANYCVETWYEEGRVIRSVNGLGNRIIREEYIDRKRVETRPNESYPWDPYRIPGMALHLIPRMTPVNSGPKIIIDPIPFFYQQSVVAYGFSTTATVVGRR